MNFDDLQGEPLIHSHHTDGLPKKHIWAEENVYCGCCGIMVHSGNNECMRTWFEWGKYVLCAECYSLPLIVSLVDFIETATMLDKNK
jgi:hypothetical protein